MSFCYNYRMWTIEYILSQICIVIAVGIFISTTFLRNRKLVIFLNCIVNSIYIIHYILLSKYIGVVINSIAIARSIWFYFDSKLPHKNYLSLIFCSLSMTLAGVLTYSNPLDIFAIIGSVISTFGLWQSNMQVYRICLIINNLCYMIFNLSIKSYLSVTFECVIIITSIINLIKFYKETKKKKDLIPPLQQNQL